MFSKKTLEEKIAVMQHYLNGGDIVVDGRVWSRKLFGYPNFNWEAFEYNIYEEPKTKPSINWEHVSKEYKYMATDCSGRTYLHIDEPTLKGTYWTTDPACKPANVFSSYIPGTCDWKDSLVKRPD